MFGMPSHRQFTPKAFLNIDHLPGVARRNNLLDRSFAFAFPYQS
jgi:hypothetical protein